MSPQELQLQGLQQGPPAAQGPPGHGPYEMMAQLKHAVQQLTNQKRAALDHLEGARRWSRYETPEGKVYHNDGTKSVWDGTEEWQAVTNDIVRTQAQLHQIEDTLIQFTRKMQALSANPQHHMGLPPPEPVGLTPPGLAGHMSGLRPGPKVSSNHEPKCQVAPGLQQGPAAPRGGLRGLEPLWQENNQVEGQGWPQRQQHSNAGGSSHPSGDSSQPSQPWPAQGSNAKAPDWGNQVPGRQMRSYLGAGAVGGAGSVPPGLVPEGVDRQGPPAVDAKRIEQEEALRRQNERAQQFLQQQRERRGQEQPQVQVLSQGDHSRAAQALLEMLKPAGASEQENAPTDPKSPAADAAAPAEETKEKAAKPHVKRVSGSQVGRLQVVGNDSRASSGGGCMAVKPKSSISVRFELPAACVEGAGLRRARDAQPQVLMVGLYRIGVGSNKNAIIAKRAFDRGRGPRTTTFNTVEGSVPFFAPKSVGRFVFRMFDDNAPIETLATTRPWIVDAQGRDVEQSIKFVMGQLSASDGKGSMGAIAQLTHVLSHLQVLPQQRHLAQVAYAVWEAVQAAHHMVEKEDANMDGKESAADRRCDRSSASMQPIRSLHGAVWGVYSSIVTNPKVHKEPKTFLISVPSLLKPIAMPFPASLLQAQTLLRVPKAWQQLYCPFEEKFFPSYEKLSSHWISLCGFRPLANQLRELSPGMLESLSEQVEAVMPHLLPGPEFHTRRESVRAALLDIIVGQGHEVPAGTRLEIFGSSRNGFGSASADLDMCLVFPSSTDKALKESGELIEDIAEKLEAAGMHEVDSRPTARMPIVLFKEPGSGLDCDISIMNPLALKNTELLWTYSQVDERVKHLAFIIKHWARSRQINNASQGTLSSYGYLLCLIHFLQLRSPPVVPNLQALSPDWGKQGTSETPLRPSPYLPQQPTQCREGRVANTYFARPTVQHLREYASHNRESTGQLLTAFFRYFAWEFDYRHDVVSVRVGGMLDKELKMESDCWGSHTRLSIEDPFETWYDVAHVLKWSRQKHVRQEFVRAYSMICAASDSMNHEDLLAELTAEAPSPPFLHQDIAEGEGEAEPGATELHQ
ncbi:unnamed protein product [Chrysoparadoxa australica]